MRISSFQHHPHEYESCPDVADWTDPRLIASRAASIAKPGEQLSDPVLTYDRSPDRLAWKVEARHPGGSTRRLFVAGTAAYEDVGAQGLM
jgi:hypothetical protein